MRTPWIVCAVGKPVQPSKPLLDIRLPDDPPAPASRPLLHHPSFEIAPVTRSIPDASEMWRDLRFDDTDGGESFRREADVRRQAEGRVEIEEIWTEFGVEREGSCGLLIHAHFTSINLHNRGLQAIAFFYHDDGIGGEVESSSDEFSATHGGLCVARDFSPPYRRAIYDDFSCSFRSTSCAVPTAVHGALSTRS